MQLQQRDNEIQILVAFIRKREAIRWDKTRPLSAHTFRDPPSLTCLNPSTKEYGHEITSCQLFARKNVQPLITNTLELKKPISMALSVAESPTKIAPISGVMDKEKAFELYVELQLILHTSKSKSSTTYMDFILLIK